MRSLLRRTTMRIVCIGDSKGSIEALSRQTGILDLCAEENQLGLERCNGQPAAVVFTSQSSQELAECLRGPDIWFLKKNKIAVICLS